MSARAILKAVEARLRTLLADPAGKVSGAQPDGKPPPGSGQWYTAAHWAGATARSDGTIADAVDLDHAVTVTISARMGQVPQDRRGERITLGNELLARAEALAAPQAIHGNYEDVMNAANALIPGTAEYAAIHGGGVTTNGFEEPLLLLGYGPCEEKPGSWVGSKESPEVLVIAVRFGKARRLQV